MKRSYQKRTSRKTSESGLNFDTSALPSTEATLKGITWILKNQSPKRTSSWPKTVQKPWGKKDPVGAKERDVLGSKLRVPFYLVQARYGRSSSTSPAPEGQFLTHSYESNLPTSLSYILSTGGSLPRRPAADMSTNRRDTYRFPLLDFQGLKIRTLAQLRYFSRF